MTADPATVAQLVFDHRASIVGYLNEQANAFELQGQRDFANTLRAQASNLAIQCDIKAGSKGVASPVDAIVFQVCATFGGTNHAEVTTPHNQRDAACRARTAAMWVARQRLIDWTEDQLAAGFGCRDRSTVSKAVRRATELRENDIDFRRLTDRLVERVRAIRCEHCQADLLPG